MKKILAVVTIAFVFMNAKAMSGSREEKYTDIPYIDNTSQLVLPLVEDYNNVQEIEVYAPRPCWPNDNDRRNVLLYDYSTTDTNEIKLLAHMLNSVSVEESEYKHSDYYSIYIKYKDKTSQYYELYDNYISTGDYHVIGFSIPETDRDRFLSTVTWLKFKDIVFEKDVTFEISAWAENPVHKAIEEGYVPKWNQINYTGEISRLEVCQLVDNFLKKNGFESDDNAESPFTDTNDPSVIMLSKFGIIEGKTDDKFFPCDFVTREELAKILYKTYCLFDKNFEAAKENSYTDKSTISEWSMESVNAMTSLKVFSGDENGSFMPKEHSTKEQVILTLLRLRDIVE